MTATQLLGTAKQRAKASPIQHAGVWQISCSVCCCFFQFPFFKQHKSCTFWGCFGLLAPHSTGEKSKSLVRNLLQHRRFLLCLNIVSDLPQENETHEFTLHPHSIQAPTLWFGFFKGGFLYCFFSSWTSSPTPPEHFLSPRELHKFEVSFYHPSTSEKSAGSGVAEKAALVMPFGKVRNQSAEWILTFQPSQ